MANTTKIDVRNVVQKTPLSRLAPTAGVDPNRVELDDILASLNIEVTPLLEMRATEPTADLVLNIGNIYLADPNSGINKTIPPISNLLPNFTSGTVTFPASTGGSATPSAGDAITIDCPSGQHLKVGINLDPNGNIVLQAGNPGNTFDLATAPPLVPSTHAIGFVHLFNNGGTIQNIENGKIYQYVGGGAGGSGTGDASSIVARLQDTFEDSIYSELSAIDFSSDQDTHVDGASTGTYSLVSSTYEFTASSQNMLSTNLLSSNFIADVKNVTKVRLSVFWDEDKVDTSAVYKVSRDAGSFLETITMERVGDSDTYTGTIEFSDGETPVNLSAQATQDFALDLNSAFVYHSQQITISALSVLKEFVPNLTKVGSPLGKIRASIYTDNAGEPDSILAQSSNTLDVASQSAGDFTFVFNFDTVLASGDYHLVLTVDQEYINSYSDGVNEISTYINSTTGAGDFYTSSNGVTWSNIPSTSMQYTAKGYPLDLRVQVTSGASDVAIAGYGIMYDVSAGVSQGLKLAKTFSFLSNSDNLSQFDLGFYPDPELLSVHYIEQGLVFKADAGSGKSFTISGTSIIFPANTFQQDADETVTLLAIQTDGISFDNSQQNASNISELQGETNNLGTKTAAQDMADVDFISVPYTQIVGRAPIRDLSKIPAPRLGIERIYLTSVEQLENETGPAGEPVYAPSIKNRDPLDRIRVFGKHISNNVTVGGEHLSISGGVDDIIEVTFFGTGLNVLIRELGISTRDFRVTIDNGVESGNLHPDAAGIINGRGYNTNTVINVASDLSPGIHTAKFRVNNNVYFYGFEILNESSTIDVPANSAVIVGEERHLIPANSSLGYSLQSDFDSASDTLGTKGGAVVVYSEKQADGSIAVKQRFKAVDPSQGNLGSANHTNEEVIKKVNFREFKYGLANEHFGDIIDTTTSRASTLDDGTISVVGKDVHGSSSTLSGQDSLMIKAGTGRFVNITFVGTGLDLYCDVTAALTPADWEVYVNGSNVGTLPALSSKSITPIVSGLPYGTHTVKINRVGVAGGNFGIFDFIIYGPKKPSIPEGAGKLGSYYKMADFDVVSSGSLNEEIPTGILRKMGTREMVYNGTWTLPLDLNSINGFRIQSNSVGNEYFEYTFFGTGFVYTFQTDITNNEATLNVTVDGSSDLSSYTTQMVSDAAGVSILSNNPAQIDTQASAGVAGTSGKYAVSGLPLGVHTVRFTASGAGDFIRVGSIDVITPIHSYESSAELLHDRLVGSNSIKAETGLPNFHKEKQYFPQGVDLGASKTKWQIKYLSTNFSTNDSIMRDLSFYGLEVGKTYRVTGHFYASVTSATAQFGVYYLDAASGAKVIYKHSFWDNGTDATQVTQSATTIFTAETSELHFQIFSGGTDSISGDGTAGFTHVILEELPNHIETDEW